MIQPVDGTVFGAWKERARRLRMQTYALYLAYKDPRVPWYAKALAACVVAYAFSPIDLIPDPIPVLGYLDDLVLIPLGVVLVIRMIPSSVMAECQEEARKAMEEGKPTNWVAAGVIVAIWLVLGAVGVVLAIRILRG